MRVTRAAAINKHSHLILLDMWLDGCLYSGQKLTETTLYHFRFMYVCKIFDIMSFFSLQCKVVLSIYDGRKVHGDPDPCATCRLKLNRQMRSLFNLVNFL